MLENTIGEVDHRRSKVVLLESDGSCPRFESSADCAAGFLAHPLAMFFRNAADHERVDR